MYSTCVRASNAFLSWITVRKDLWTLRACPKMTTRKPQPIEVAKMIMTEKAGIGRDVTTKKEKVRRDVPHHVFIFLKITAKFSAQCLMTEATRAATKTASSRCGGNMFGVGSTKLVDLNIELQFGIR